MEGEPAPVLRTPREPNGNATQRILVWSPDVWRRPYETASAPTGDRTTPVQCMKCCLGTITGTATLNLLHAVDEVIPVGFTVPPGGR